MSGFHPKAVTGWARWYNKPNFAASLTQAIAAMEGDSRGPAATPCHSTCGPYDEKFLLI